MSRRDPPEVRQRRGSAEPLPKRCGAKLALTDPPRYCTQRQTPGGNGRCNRFGHHAFGQRGQDNPAYKTGENSRYAYLNPKVQDALLAALANEHLMDLTEDVGLLDVLKQDAAKNWQVGASAEAWAALRPTALAFLAARGRKAQASACRRLVRLLGQVDQAKAAEGAAVAIERKVRAVTARQRLMVETEDLIPAKRVTLVMAGMAALVREFLSDEQRSQFARRFAGFLGRRLSPPSLAGSVVVDAEPASKPTD